MEEHELTRPAFTEEGRLVHNRWLLCPTLNEPVMILHHRIELDCDFRIAAETVFPPTEI